MQLAIYQAQPAPNTSIAPAQLTHHDSAEHDPTVPPPAVKECVAKPRS